MKTNTKLILGILLAFSIIGFIILWDLVIVDNIESEEVVIVKPGLVLHKYDEITQESFLVEKRNRSTLVEGYLKPTDIKTMIGKQVKQTLVGNQLVSTRFIDMDDFEPDATKGEAIRPIPNQWIYALPNTVRRKDNIDIYLVLSEEEKAKQRDQQKELTSNSKKDNGSQPSMVGLSPEQSIAVEQEKKTLKKEDEAYTEERNSIVTNTAINVVSAESVYGEKQEVLDYLGERDAWLQEKGLTASEWAHMIEQGDMPILVDVPVAYAKDGAGNEVLTNPGEEVNVPEQKQAERLTSTGAIVNLELVLTEENHRQLLSYINKGYQLYITYN